LECYRDAKHWIADLPEHLEIYVHIPACYIGIGYGGEPYNTLRDNCRLAQTDGKPVEMFNAHLVNMGLDGVQVARIIADFFGVPHPRVTGLFLDCVWDKIGWTSADNIHDDDWAEGMRLFVTALRFRMGRNGWRGLKLIGNGWTTMLNHLDGLCYESWPNIMGSSAQGTWHEAMYGKYGVGNTHMEEYHFIPPGTGYPGEGIDREDRIKTAAFAALVEAHVGVDTLIWQNKEE